MKERRDELRRSKCVGLLLSGHTPELLVTTQSYPYWDRLPGAVFPQRGDVLRIIDAFLNKTTKVEDFLRISDLLLDHPSCAPDNRWIPARDTGFVLEKATTKRRTGSSPFMREPSVFFVSSCLRGWLCQCSWASRSA